MNKKKLIFFLFFIFIKQNFIFSSLQQITRINNIVKTLNPLENNSNYSYIRFADKKIIKNILELIKNLIKNILRDINLDDNLKNKDKKQFISHLEIILENINIIDNNKKFLENNKNLEDFIKYNNVAINSFFSNINELLRIRILKNINFENDLKLIADYFEKLDKSPLQQDLSIIKNHIYNNWKKYLTLSLLLYNYQNAYKKDYQNLINIEHNYKSIFNCKECSGTDSLIKQSIFYGGNIIRDLTRITFNKDKNKYSTFIAGSISAPIKLLTNYIMEKGVISAIVAASLGILFFDMKQRTFRSQILNNYFNLNN